MKKLLIILMLLSNTTFAQYKYKAKYRPAPRKGEIIAVSGLLIYAASASGLIGYETNFSKSVGVAGKLMIPLGVVINMGDLKRKKRKR